MHIPQALEKKGHHNNQKFNKCELLSLLPSFLDQEGRSEANSPRQGSSHCMDPTVHMVLWGLRADVFTEFNVELLQVVSFLFAQLSKDKQWWSEKTPHQSVLKSRGHPPGSAQLWQWQMWLCGFSLFSFKHHDTPGLFRWRLLNWLLWHFLLLYLLCNSFSRKLQIRRGDPRSCWGVL